jgi:hypothetical protein
MVLPFAPVGAHLVVAGVTVQTTQTPTHPDGDGDEGYAKTALRI